MRLPYDAGLTPSHLRRLYGIAALLLLCPLVSLACVLLVLSPAGWLGAILLAIAYTILSVAVGFEALLHRSRIRPPRPAPPPVPMRTGRTLGRPAVHEQDPDPWRE